MDLLLSPQRETASNERVPVATFGQKARAVLTSWELYPLLLIADFLRFFHIDRVVFGQDEANVYQLAHDAIVHGFIPLTSNQASLGNLNPPLVVYFFMIPASLSANPLWGNCLVAFFSVAAVLLTYFFARRYYGRLAGTIAAFLFATSVGVWQYSRNIWPQNFLPFFVLLFIWTLFRGVVEKKKGWFRVAILLLGILYQFHGSTLYLIIPLAAAVVFAFKTIRWRDLGYALLGLLLIFAPFLVWEFKNGFVDIKLMLTTAQQQATFDLAALHDYLFFLHPTLINPYVDMLTRNRDTHLLLPDAQSVLLATPLHYAHVFLQGGYALALLLLLGGIAIAAALVLMPRLFGPVTTETLAKKGLARWWHAFQANPQRQGLALLLLWQLAPLALFLRHSLILFEHYFIFLLPGPFILMAIAITQISILAQKHRPAWGRWVHAGMVIAGALVILAQLIGTGGTLIDLTTGNFNAHALAYNFADLHSQQNALQAADQLAQQRGIHRIYVTASDDTNRAMTYLIGQLKTPVELNDDDRARMATDCLILPDVSAGPVVFLAEPNERLATVRLLLNLYTTATLVSKPPHLGSAPYELYILTAKTMPAALPHTFEHSLRQLSPAALLLPNALTLATRWQIADTRPFAARTSYHYIFQIQPGNNSGFLDCQPTSTWAGDQMIVFQRLEAQGTPPSQISVQVSTFTTQPDLIQAGFLTLTSFREVNTPTQILLTADQKSSVTLPVRTTP